MTQKIIDCLPPRAFYQGSSKGREKCYLKLQVLYEDRYIVIKDEP